MSLIRNTDLYKVRITGLKISNAERRILNEEEKPSDYKNTILGTYLILAT